MFAYPALGQAADPLASYRAAQAARIRALQPQAPTPAPGALGPPPALPPVRVLAPPMPTPRWAVYGGIALGVTVLGLVAYAILRRRR